MEGILTWEGRILQELQEKICSVPVPVTESAQGP